MANKPVIVLCVQTLLIQSALSQCTGSINSPALRHNGFANCSPSASNSGSFICTSSSPIAPTGISIFSTNFYEGPLNTGGVLPMLGSVDVEGEFPNAGAGAVSYGCGDESVAIADDTPVVSNPVAAASTVTAPKVAAPKISTPRVAAIKAVCPKVTASKISTPIVATSLTAAPVSSYNTPFAVSPGYLLELLKAYLRENGKSYGSGLSYGNGFGYGGYGYNGFNYAPGFYGLNFGRCGYDF